MAGLSGEVCAVTGFTGLRDPVATLGSGIRLFPSREVHETSTERRQNRQPQTRDEAEPVIDIILTIEHLLKYRG
jgi:hypothetical protein